MSDFSDQKNIVCVMAAILEGTRSGQQWAEPSVDLAMQLYDKVHEAFEAKLQEATAGRSR